MLQEAAQSVIQSIPLLVRAVPAMVCNDAVTSLQTTNVRCARVAGAQLTRLYPFQQLRRRVERVAHDRPGRALVICYE